MPGRRPCQCSFRRPNTFGATIEHHDQPRRTTWVNTALATLLAALVLLVPIGHKPLVAWDEGIYAGVSREMLGGSWLVPHWNWQLWFEKPPLMLWITALLFKLFGVSEFTARAGSAFSGIAIVAVLHRWLARGGDRLAAWLSTFMLLSTFGFLHICSLGEMDVLLSLACLVAVLGLVRLQGGDSSGWYGFWLGFAIAVMTKGAAGVVLLLTLPVFALMHRGRKRENPTQHRRNFLLAFALFLALVMPWHIFMFARFGQAFLHEYIGFHVLSRATVQIEDHVTHAWYYAVVVLASASPWVLLYPFAAVATFRQPALRHLRIVSAFAAIVLLFFTVVQTRLPHYIAPAYPALTLLTAGWAAAKLREWKVTQASASARAGWVLAALAVWGLGAWCTDVPRKHLHSARLTRGAIAPDNREAAQLLKALRRQPGLPGGPLLLWSRASFVPIAPAVFYAERPVQQIQLGPLDPTIPIDKYLHAPEQLSDAIREGPAVVLLDRSLVAELPPGLIFLPLQSGRTLEAGLLSRLP